MHLLRDSVDFLISRRKLHLMELYFHNFNLKWMQIFFWIAQWGASLILNSTDFIESCISRRLNLEGRSRFEKLETEMRFVKPLKSLQKGQNVDESANFVEKSFFFSKYFPIIQPHSTAKKNPTVICHKFYSVT